MIICFAHSYTGLEEDEGYHHGHSRGKKSWWRGIYDRISQGGPEEEETRRHSAQKSHSGMPSLESPPPSPSIIFEYSPMGATVRPSPPRHQSKRSSLLSPPQYDDVPKRSKGHSGSRLPHRSRAMTPQPVRQYREAELPPSQATPAGGPLFARSDSSFGSVLANALEDTPSHAKATALPPLPEHQTVPSLPSGYYSKRRMPHRAPRPKVVLPAPLSPARYYPAEQDVSFNPSLRRPQPPPAASDIQSSHFPSIISSPSSDRYPIMLTSPLPPPH